MAKHGCIKIELDESKYSSPIPVIGLYVAASSLVCSLAMLYDIFFGFRHRKQWIPSRWLSLNSVTLTLISIAAKVPVDLTTPMPGPLDQFSKLSGTVLICVSMGFLMPSLGSNQNSECLQNMAALTILVFTAIVNICLQISTGVIVLFVSDHIIIMCCMFTLLSALWVSALDINKKKDVSIDHNKELLAKADGSLLQKLKLAYLYGYNCNPQFVLCRQPNCHLVGALCLLCFVVTTRALVRSLTSEFCKGENSDYDWSLVMIVGTQIVAIVIGCFATTFRSWFTLIRNIKFNPIGKAMKDETRTMINSNPLLTSDYFGEILHVLMMLQTIIVICSVIIPLCLILIGLRKFVGYTLGLRDEPQDQSFTDLIHEGEMGFDRWSLNKSLRDMKICIEASKRSSGNRLSELISKTPSSQPLNGTELRDEAQPSADGVHVSLLSMVLLVRMVEVVIPKRLSGLVVEAFGEVYETIRYIDDKLISTDGEKRIKSQVAKAVRVGDDFASRKIFDLSEMRGTNPVHSELYHALVIIHRLKNTLPLDTVWIDVAAISGFICRRQYASVEDLYNCMEQMFVDMLHMYLSKIPSAIFREVTESPAEVFDKKTRVALKLLCRFESMEAQIQWSFPVQSNISRLITVQDPPIQTSTNNLVIQISVQDPAITSTTYDLSIQGPVQNPASTSPTNNPSIQNLVQHPAITSPTNDPSIQDPVQDPAITSPTNDHSIQISVQDPSIQGPVQDHATTSPSNAPSVQGLVQDLAITSPTINLSIQNSVQDPMISGRTNDPSIQSPVEDDAITSPTNDSIQISVQDPAITSPTNNLSIQNSVQDHAITSATVDPTIQGPVQDLAIASPNNDPSIQISVQDPAITRNDPSVEGPAFTSRTNDPSIQGLVQDLAITNPTIDLSIQISVQDPAITSATNDPSIQSHVQDTGITSPIINPSIQISVQDPTITSLTNDPSVQDSSTGSPIQNPSTGNPNQDSSMLSVGSPSWEGNAAASDTIRENVNGHTTSDVVHVFQIDHV